MTDDQLESAVRRALGTVAGGVEPPAGLEQRAWDRARARRRRPTIAGVLGAAVAVAASVAVLPGTEQPDPANVTAGPAASVSIVPPPSHVPTPTTSTAGPATMVVPTTASAAPPSTQAPPTTVAAPAPVVPCLASTSGRATVLPSALPHRYITTQGFSDGRYAYLLGGTYEQPGGVAYSDEILRFDPATGEVGTAVARLPSPLAYAATVWDGTAAYLLGGYSQAEGYWNGIVRFVPATGEVRVLAQRLPGPLANAAAVWAGGHAYLFGGGGASSGDYYSNRILRFTPGTGEVRVMEARLPKAGWNMAALWDGRQAVVAGGNGGGYASGDSDLVVSYDPASDTVRSLGSLPGARSGASLVGTCDQQVLVLGGSHADGAQVLRFDPATGGSTVVGTLPGPKQHGLAVTDGAATWLLGAGVPLGPTTAGASDEIVRFGP